MLISELQSAVDELIKRKAIVEKFEHVLRLVDDTLSGGATGDNAYECRITLTCQNFREYDLTYDFDLLQARELVSDDLDHYRSELEKISEQFQTEIQEGGVE